MKVLVTGGLGFIGSNLVESLKKEAEVVVVDNLSSSRKDYKEILEKNSGVEYVLNCFSSDEVLNRVKNSEFDFIFHVAAIPRVSYSVENPYQTTEVNVGKTVKIMESCIDTKTKIIFSSSSSVYGGADIMPTPSSHPKDPKSPYAWQKSCIEDLLRVFYDLYKINSICLRYFNVFGPGQFGGSAYSTAISAWCNAVKENKPLRSDGTGEQSRDLCYVDNVVHANLLSMREMQTGKVFSGESVNVACGDRTSNNEILEYFNNKYNGLVVQNAPWRPGDVMHTQADLTATKNLIGYEPLVKFWDGLEVTLKWWESL